MAWDPNKNPASLMDFMEENTNRPGAVCRTCQVVPEDLRKEIAQARTSTRPPAWTTISDWLRKEHALEVSATALRNHYLRHAEEA